MADLGAISRNQFKFGAWLALIVCLVLVELQGNYGFCATHYRWSVIAIHGYFIILTAFVLGDVLGDSGERGFTELILFAVGAIAQIYVGIDNLASCTASRSSDRLYQIIYGVAAIVAGALLIIEIVQKRRN